MYINIHTSVGTYKLHRKRDLQEQLINRLELQVL